jgi:hypothetical protein
MSVIILWIKHSFVHVWSLLELTGSEVGNMNIFCKRKKKNFCDFVNFWKTFLFYTRDLYLNLYLHVYFNKIHIKNGKYYQFWYHIKSSYIIGYNNVRERINLWPLKGNMTGLHKYHSSWEIWRLAHLISMQYVYCYFKDLGDGGTHQTGLTPPHKYLCDYKGRLSWLL